MTPLNEPQFSERPWTQGPWRLEPTGNPYGIIADLYDFEVVTGDGSDTEYRKGESLADGTLLALAPEMAEAILAQAEACRWSSAPCPCAGDVHDLADKLRAIGGTS